MASRLRGARPQADPAHAGQTMATTPAERQPYRATKTPQANPLWGFPPVALELEEKVISNSNKIQFLTLATRPWMVHKAPPGNSTALLPT